MRRCEGRGGVKDDHAHAQVVRPCICSQAHAHAHARTDTRTHVRTHTQAKAQQLDADLAAHSQKRNAAIEAIAAKGAAESAKVEAAAARLVAASEQKAEAIFFDQTKHATNHAQVTRYVVAGSW